MDQLASQAMMHSPRNTMERSHGPIGLWGHHDALGSRCTASMGLMDQVASKP